MATDHRPVMFVLWSSLVFFAWGEIFSLFPSLTANLYGRTWATTNYGIVYTAKGTAAIFAAPVAAYVMLRTGSWIPVFYVMIVCDITAAFMALLWLKPVATGPSPKLRARRCQRQASEPTARRNQTLCWDTKTV